MRNPELALTAGLVLLLCAAGPKAEAKIKKSRPIKRPAAAAAKATNPPPTPEPPPDAVPAAPADSPATPDSVAVTPSSVSATPEPAVETPVVPAVPVVPVVPVAPVAPVVPVVPAVPVATPVSAMAPQSPLPAAGPAPLPSELDLFQLDSKVSLMAIRVTVASKSEESILDVPANVTVYSAQDIKALGYYTLADLANITAGYSSYTIYGEKVFETRGQKAGSFNNNKHLLLIDGIPVSHARANSLRAEEELPLLFARQVEFLRAPAARCAWVAPARESSIACCRAWRKRQCRSAGL